MAEMIERVAREIALAQLSRQYIGKLKNIGAVIEMDRVWPEFVPDARAALRAMREPTQQMRLAGIAEWSRPDPPPEHGCTLVFDAVFRAMIDAALAVKE